MVQEAERNFPRIVANFPERFTYRDLDDPQPGRTFPEKTGRIILSGGESLLDAVRERVTYPVVERLRAKYAAQGGVKVVVQTTGDILTDAIVDELLERGVWMISVASVDDFHVGLEGPGEAEARSSTSSPRCSSATEWPSRPVGDDAQLARGGRSRLQLLRRDAGHLDRQAVAARARVAERAVARDARGQLLQSLVGRAQLPRHRFDGSEVSIEPDGSVYPCCVKTKLPIGNLLEDELIEILESLVGIPAYEAITMGHPERMGIAHGWDEESSSPIATRTPNGAPYRNLCIGCDRFHEQVLGPMLEAARARAAAAKGVGETVEPSRKVICSDSARELSDALPRLHRGGASRDAAPSRRPRRVSTGTTSSRRQRDRRSTSMRGPATRRRTRSSSGPATKSADATASSSFT